MVIWVAVIAAVTVLLCTLLVCAAISIRPTTPCLFSNTDVYVGESVTRGGRCTGKADNVYMTWGGPTDHLNDVRACNGHVGQLLSVADALVRESLPLK
jgi:hypothetical protein